MLRSLFALACLCLPQIAVAERHAFVLSNAEYAELSDLRNTHADAAAYARAFEDLGYAVEAHKDLDRLGIVGAFHGFLDKVQPGDDVVFVYSGHGWSNGATNYIVPTNVALQAPQHDALLEYETVPLQNGVNGLLDLLSGKDTNLTIAIIDACRNNPFAPPPGRKSFGISRGLQVTPSSQGSFVVYSAGQGQEALDRLPSDGLDESLSVFTRNFVKHLRPGVFLHEAVLNARSSTTAQAQSIGHLQTPAYYDQTIQKVCLSGDCSKPVALGKCDALWETAQDSAACFGYEAYLAECEDHVFSSVATSFVDRQCTAPDLASVGPNDHPDVLACLQKALHPAQGGLEGAASNLAGVLTDDIASDAPEMCQAAVAKFPEYVPAQVALARALYFHATETLDEEEAIDLFRAAAQAGDAAAALEMAILTEDGMVAAADNAGTVDWYRQAAMGGVVSAQLRLGQMYDRGTGGVDEDLDEAALWYRQAADNGDSVAQAYVGWSYKVGRGVAENPERAAEWFQLAVDQGHVGAHFMLGDLYYEGQGKDQNYPKAAELYLTAAKEHHAKAQLALGFMYSEGLGVDQSYDEAAYWYQRAAEQGEPSAQFHLSILYLDGRGVPKDEGLAAHWTLKAAEQGVITAQANMGLIYEAGMGVDQDDAKAVTWFTRAAEAGDANSQTNLGLMYENARGVEQDLGAAVQWYDKAAKQGNTRAQTNLGWLYFKGLGVKRSRKAARDLFVTAAKQGNDRAQELLRKHYPFFTYK